MIKASVRRMILRAIRATTPAVCSSAVTTRSFPASDLKTLPLSPRLVVDARVAFSTKSGQNTEVAT